MPSFRFRYEPWIPASTGMTSRRDWVKFAEDEYDDEDELEGRG